MIIHPYTFIFLLIFLLVLYLDCAHDLCAGTGQLVSFGHMAILANLIFQIDL